MKCTVLDIKSTTDITTSNLTDFRSSTIKLMLIISYHVSKIVREYSSPIDRY